jgi:hypothetical protein
LQHSQTLSHTSKSQKEDDEPKQDEEKEPEEVVIVAFWTTMINRSVSADLVLPSLLLFLMHRQLGNNLPPLFMLPLIQIGAHLPFSVKPFNANHATSVTVHE